RRQRVMQPPAARGTRLPRRFLVGRIDVDRQNLVVRLQRRRERGIVREPEVAAEPDDRNAHAPCFASVACLFFGRFATTSSYERRTYASSSSRAKRSGSVTLTQNARAMYGAGIMPGCSVSSRKRSVSTLNEKRPRSGPIVQITQNILLATLN